MTFQSLVICGRWLDWCTRNDSMWHDFVLGDFRARLRLEVRSADAWLGADGRSEMEKPLRRRRQNLVLCGPGGEPGSLGFLKDHSATTPYPTPPPESRVSNFGISICYCLFWLTEMICIDCFALIACWRWANTNFILYQYQVTVHLQLVLVTLPCYPKMDPIAPSLYDSAYVLLNILNYKLCGATTCHCSFL